MTTNATPGAAEQAAAQQAAEQQAARDNAAKEARTAERARMSGILGCEEAQGRGTLANHIAMNTEMSLADAKLMLAAAPKEAAAAPAPQAQTQANPFQQAMDAGGTPGVKPDAALAQGAQSGGGQMSSADQAAAILADQHAATGRPELKLVGQK